MTTPSLSPDHEAIRFASVSKHYGKAARRVTALDDVSLALARGTFTAVMGPSGSGKSTFLHVAAGLDRPTAGAAFLGEIELARLDEAALSRLRRERIGFVFQSFNLVPALSAAQNVTLPLRLAGRKPDAAWLREVVERVGLADRMRHRPAELSGGQQQRVAIARALVGKPRLILADEPTGALDSETSQQIMDLMSEIHRSGITVLVVSHDADVAARTQRIIRLRDGKVMGPHDLPSHTSSPSIVVMP